MSVLALTFLREPPGPDAIKPLYAVFGDEPYLKRAAVDAIRAAVLGPEPDELGESVFRGEEILPAEVFDAARTRPFLSPRRLVLVEDADAFVTKTRKELEAYAERPSAVASLCLVVGSWPNTTRLAKVFETKGTAVDCRAPREPEIPAFLTALAKTKHGMKLGTEAARLMVELAGAEVGLLVAELDKLAAYVGKAKEIAAADVTKMVGSGRVEQIWLAIDAATLGQLPEALDMLDRLLAANEPPIKILAAISTTLTKVYHAGQLRMARKSAAEAAQAAGVPPFKVEQLTRQHAHLGPTRTAKLPQWLLQADLDLKGDSPLSPRAILERLFVALGRPRTD